MIKTKQELLNHFSDINAMYNNPFMYQTLSNMIDELLESQPCEDAVSRESVIEWLKDKDIIKMNYQEENARRELAELPSVTPSYNSIKTELDHVIDEIIIRIEETRDKDKLCEYPYNRCIRILKEEFENDKSNIKI